MTGRAIGWYFVFVGLVVCLPITGRIFRWFRDVQLRLMPWIRKLPGGWFYESDSVERVMRIGVGVLFIVVGLLAGLGVFEFDS